MITSRLAIEVEDEAVMKRLHHVVHHDREHSRPLDLTDEGLLADLKEEADEAAAMLALDERGRK